MEHLLLTCLFLLPSAQQSPNWETVNVNDSGALSSGDAGAARMSDDGRFVVYETLGTNFGWADGNGTYDVVLRDRVLDTVELISVSTGGTIGNKRSRWPSVSEDGRYVVFVSEADDLVGGDTNGVADLFLRDRTLGTTERVSVGTLGVQADGSVLPENASVSDDGRYVTFATYALNLSVLDGDGYTDVYRRDRTSDETLLVSYNVGMSDNTRGFHPSMSSDGRYVAFDSNGFVTALSGGSWLQVYVRDMITGAAALISTSTLTGLEGSGNSEYPEISDDGAWVAFQSKAGDLVSGDLNGVTPDAFLAGGGALELVSLDESGVHTSLGATRPHCSDDGRYVVFQCGNSQVAGYTGSGHFLRDRVAATTELVEIPFPWNAVHPTLFSNGARVSDGASEILLGVATYIPGAIGPNNVVIRKRTAGQDGVFLTGSTYGSVGGSVSWSGAHAPASAPFWIATSFKQTGLIYGGHGFDLGPPARVAGGGTTTASGTLSFTGGPLPASVSGRTLYVEAAVLDAGTWYDSNLLWLEVF